MMKEKEKTSDFKKIHQAARNLPSERSAHPSCIHASMHPCDIVRPRIHASIYFFSLVAWCLRGRNFHSSSCNRPQRHIPGFFIAIILVLLSAPGLPGDQIEPPTRTLVSIKQLDGILRQQVDCFLKIAEEVQTINKSHFFKPYDRDSKAKISHLLKKAARIEPDECYKQYLLSLAYNVPDDTFYTLAPDWYDLENPRAEIIFLPDEAHIHQELWVKLFLRSFGLDWQRFKPGNLETKASKEGKAGKAAAAASPGGFPPLGSQKIFDTFVFLHDEKETRRYREYTDAFDKMQVRLPSKTTQKIVPYTPQVPPVIIANLVYSSLPGRMSIVCPDREAFDQGGRYKMVIFKNLIDAYVECILKPMAGEIFQENPFQPMEVDTEAYLSNLVMQKISHYLGPIFAAQAPAQGTVEKETAEKLPFISQVIGNATFLVVETLKTNVLAIYNTTVLIEQGLIPREKAAHIYATYLVSLIDKIRKDPRRYTSQAYITQFNYLLKKEALRFDVTTKKISIQMHIFPGAVEEFAKSVVEMYSMPGAMLRDFGRLSPELTAILNNLGNLPPNVNIDVNIKEEIKK